MNVDQLRQGWCRRRFVQLYTEQWMDADETACQTEGEVLLLLRSALSRHHLYDTGHHHHHHFICWSKNTYAV